VHCVGYREDEATWEPEKKSCLRMNPGHARSRQACHLVLVGAWSCPVILRQRKSPQIHHGLKRKSGHQLQKLLVALSRGRQLWHISGQTCGERDCQEVKRRLRTRRRYLATGQRIRAFSATCEAFSRLSCLPQFTQHQVIPEGNLKPLHISLASTN
jgi:hypothetical protein